MEIGLEKLRYMMGLFEGGGDYQDAWESLKKWLDKVESAQQMRAPDEAKCPHCGELLAAAALHEFCYPPASPRG